MAALARVLKAAASWKGQRLQAGQLPRDMGSAFAEHYEACKDFTMTSAERLFGLSEAVRFVAAAGIPGDFVECGVWKGGSALLMARVLSEVGDTSRPIWLYDTFTGMAEPTAEDGQVARSRWQQARQRDSHTDWCFSPLQEVQSVMERSAYPPDKLLFVAGKVEDTIPSQAPDRIALLRLDTDWYGSTLHELVHLWPRLSPGGVLIIDDYGHWEGARRAVDEFFAATPILMHRLDYTGRAIQKPR